MFAFLALQAVALSPMPASRGALLARQLLRRAPADAAPSTGHKRRSPLESRHALLAVPSGAPSGAPSRQFLSAAARARSPIDAHYRVVQHLLLDDPILPAKRVVALRNHGQETLQVVRAR